jgi:translation initiation factor IF-3
VDEKGQQLGVMPTRQALEFAQERGLDLVEVAPAADPPVCRVMDYGKFRYQATRREREARKDHKSRSSNELREVRLKTRIGEHDRASKTRLVRRLLQEGSKVKVSVMFRGREIAHPEIGMAVLRAVAEDLVGDARMEKTPSFEGRFLTMILTPESSAPAASSEAKDARKAKEPSGAKA